ncbi:hypothetical protein SARC_05286 [Sphaeroforma arctica JP610]|uniref:Uncharacterized protein n=1 Tax=Sphaeroforma arctica JP610 TaxID=667725 RepID=A0A0L0G0S4_9EUKA|nr:hypothetical protein SARC_05286 [Sphaeroforma arctica JP610]KNC82436.1 hypothetical protein SARC_05286 [Sphaeroforma arctica JP610]|eukprot:XP_014156338.1 hypothetical protein SARC_05286 [Sphaeroforma arctica JP610]
MGVLGWAVMMFGLVCVCIAYLRHFNLKSTDEHEAIPMDNLSNTHHRAQRSDYPHTDHAQHPDYLQQPGHLQRPGNLSPATGRSRQSSRSPSPMFGGHSPDAQRSHRINMPLLSNAEAMALDAAGAGESVDGLSAYSGAHRHFTAEDLGNDEDELDEAGNNDGARLLSNR